MYGATARNWAMENSVHYGALKMDRDDIFLNVRFFPFSHVTPNTGHQEAFGRWQDPAQV